MTRRKVKWFAPLIAIFAILMLAVPSLAAKIRLEFWTPLTTNADKAAHEQLIAAFEKENPNVEMVVQYVSHKDWMTKWMTAIMSDQKPHLSLLDESETSWLQSLGVIEPVEDIIAELDPGKSDFGWGRGDILKFMTPDGHIWAVPYAVNINALWYRKDILSEAGVNGRDIRTWDELHSIALKTSNPPETYGLGLALARELCAQQQMFIWTNANGGTFFDPETGAYLLDQPETRKKVGEALEWLKRLYDDQVLPRGVANWMWVDYRTAMAEGKLVFTSSWGGDIGIAREQNPAMLDNLSVTAHPIGPSASSYPALHDAGAWAWAVTKTEDEAVKEAIRKWLHFFFRPENVAVALAARPVYNLPVQRSVFESPIYVADPVTKQFFNEAKYLYDTVLPLAQRVGFEAGPSPVPGQISARLFPSDAVHYYLFSGWSLDRTLDWLDSQFKELFEEIDYPLEGWYSSK
jgi:multiple sugar transport system substrate-binding protein